MSDRRKRSPVEYLPKSEPLRTTVDRVIENIGKRGTEPELKTGIDAIDKGTLGLHPSQLTVVAARPGQGKTSLASQFAYNLADANKKVTFISLELTRETLIEKIFCQQHRVNSRKLLTNTLDEKEKEQLKIFGDVISQMPIHIVDDYCFNENELFTLIEHLENRPEILILDHIQHIRTDDARVERETLNNYLRYLKEIAMKFGIAVVVLSQINRQGDEKPTLANLKGTGSIEEIADAVIILHQKVQKENFVERDSNLIEVIMDVAKNRFGPVGFFETTFEAHTGRFLNQIFLKDADNGKDWTDK